MEDEKLTNRIANSAIILAILFGIIQTIPSDKKYNFLGIEASLKVIGQVSFQSVLLIFLIYFILIGINLAYGMRNSIPAWFLKFFYNTAILFSFLIIFYVIGFAFILSLLNYLPQTWIVNLMITFLIITAVIFSILFVKYVTPK